MKNQLPTSEEYKSARIKMRIGITVFETPNGCIFSHEEVIQGEPPSLKTLDMCSLEELKFIAGNLIGVMETLDMLIEKGSKIEIPIKVDNNDIKS